MFMLRLPNYGLGSSVLPNDRAWPPFNFDVRWPMNIEAISSEQICLQLIVERVSQQIFERRMDRFRNVGRRHSVFSEKP